MAKAAPESALTFVALKVILTALEAIPDESPEGARRLVIEGCRPEGPIHWKCREPANPPADFFCGDPGNFIFSHSDVTNRAAGVISEAPFVGFYAIKLRSVQLAWEDVAALRPEIGPPPAPFRPSRRGRRVPTQQDIIRDITKELYPPAGEWQGKLPFPDLARKITAEMAARGMTVPADSTYTTIRRALGLRD